MSDYKYKIGIDPGITGAVCVIDTTTNKIVVLEDMPVIANGKGNSTVKNMVEPLGLLRVLQPYRQDSVACLERVAGRPGNGVAATFSLGDSMGVIRAVLACSGIPTHFVTPQYWKKVYNIPTKSDKDVSRALALQLYPDADLLRKKDHNRAEALLLAHLNVL